MPPKKTATKTVAPKPAAATKTVAVKPVKEVLTKAGLVTHLAETTGLANKDVKSVIAALEVVMLGSVSKRGAGSFSLPGLFKVTATKVPAKPKRKGIDPFTKEEKVFAAKPATVKVKVRPFKKLKDAAL